MLFNNMTSLRAQMPPLIVGAIIMFITIHIYNPSTLKRSSDYNMSELVKAIAKSSTSSTSYEQPATSSIAHIDWQCKSSDDMRQLINSTDNVIVIMPAKAAGSSLKHFADGCYDGEYKFKNIQKLIGDDGPSGIESVLSNSWNAPKVFASHFWAPVKLTRLVRSTSLRTLIIYSHREENSRFKSAAFHVLSQWCKNGGHSSMSQVETDKCSINEESLIKILKARPEEMQMGTNELLTCETYNAIEEYAPNMIFMDFKSANNIQSLIAEKYCPHMANHHIAKGDDKISVVIKNGTLVSLSTWLDQKSSYLDWSLELNKRANCLVKTRHMEENLNTCEGGFLHAKSIPN